MNRIELGILAATIIFTIFTTVYAASADSRSVRVLPKFVWVLLCLFVPIIGGLLYITIGRPIDGESGQGAKISRPKAPDDDPDFLRDLGTRFKNNKDNRDG
ncbi:MAG: PLDc_N domain-containing protein [Micrococcales bacterium]|nr:PLDc_N domain-containing protein [Micrococcales bacterium]NBR62050.1 PLDc_N domain-containing protein [Actinomycetota bacterium]NBR55363.1 PLDc_N domain-containing protein [Micrococcales bacterium]NBT49149.1 PLDc_N domain-containing protein [Actinomycetota bacterium]NBY43296.1 PLDc_N domain-containing protein [Micrococcales bacterium]